MKEWAQKLLDLQNKDIQINKLERQLASVPEEKEKVEKSLEDERKRVEAARQEVFNKEKEIKNAENDIASLEQKQDDFRKKSTMIKDNDEYRAALRQIEDCDHRISELEDLQLEIMEQLEAAKSRLREEKKALSAEEKRAEELLQDLDKRAENCQTQLEKCRRERQEVAAEVDKTALQRYERMLAGRKRSGGNLAVFTAIQEGNCSSCHMEIPAQVKTDANKGQMAICPYCNAMLYSEEAAN